ncbi:MAG: glycosyltransferase [candidate division KSB1 bacterium]|nr:glycosyltransferase [candidate division KSB1 bacterium]
MKTILLISYYFPPMGMGGTQRLAGFARHLPQFGWRPIVLTVKDVDYYAHDISLLKELEQVTIVRTGSLDPLRVAHVLRRWRRSARKPGDTGAIKKAVSTSRWQRWLRRCLNLVLIPDQKLLWLPFAFLGARSWLKRERVDWILTSGPPHSAHLLGWLLHRLYGVPWLADFRDGWSGGDFQAEATSLHRWLNRWLQRLVLNSATAITAVSEGLKQRLSESAPQHAPIEVITNGYEAADFASRRRAGPRDDRFDIVHVGTLGNFVDATVFLSAFQRFVQEVGLNQQSVRLWFLGADLTGELQQQVQALQLGAFVHATGYISHPEAIKRLLQADLLLYLVTGDPYPGFIPGKTFEYLAAGRPILAVCPDIEGLSIIKKSGRVRHAQPDDFDGMVLALKAFYLEFLDRKPTPSPLADVGNMVESYSRRSLTAKLVQLLERGG